MTTRRALLCCLMAAFITCCGIAGATLRAGEPFMGAYIHLPAWFRGEVDQAARRRIIIDNLDRFRDSGLRVLIPFITTTRGQALYPSKRIPNSVWSDWDPFAEIVPEAHRRGLQVYPAVCVLVAGHERPAGILNVHPDWALRDKTGQPLGFISPGNPQARQWVVSVLKEIATRYRPDGILLDYCRYPGREAWMDPVGQAKFEAAHPAGQFPPGSTRYKKAFLIYRRKCLTDLVGQISSALRALKPAPQIAVYMWGAHELRGTRDWRTWIDLGYLDMLNLSGYSYRERYGDKYLQVLDERFRGVEAILEQLNKPIELTICVGISTSHGKIRAAREIADYLQIGKRHGVHGAVFFTWETLQPFLPETRKAGYFRQFITGLPPAPSR